MALSKETARKSFIAGFVSTWLVASYFFFFDPVFFSTTPVTKQTEAPKSVQAPVPDTPGSDLPPKHSAPPPPPPGPTGDIKVESPTAKFKFGGIIDVEFSESNSWSTVFKIMVMILGVFFGIKAINAVFRKFA